MKDNAILEVKGLSKHFPICAGLTQRHVGDLKAVNDISFYVKENEVLGMVGESGCGKTTAGRTILRLREPTKGEILFRKKDSSIVDIAKLEKKELKEIRKEIRMIFQDPFSSLNPRFTVKDIIGEPLKIHKIGNRQEREDRLVELMKDVGLNPALMNRYPHEFSGGQRQRIGIARTLALNPRMIIADEPVSALDVSVQAQVLNLIQDLKADFGLTLIFVAHDLSVVEHISDRILVMYIGNIFELGKTDEMLAEPLHPYTEALISAVPSADPRIKMNRVVMEGDVPSPVNPPSGCVFHPRCRYAQEICRKEVPEFREVKPDRFCHCHFAGELKLQGIEGGLNE